MIDPKKIILALDYSTPDQAIAMAKGFQNTQIKFKIGMELFYSAGHKIIEQVQKYGDVFLDLKLHDIPTTMAKTAKVLADLNVWMFNVHASAGQEALIQVKNAVEQSSSQTLVTAVTLLTSLKDFSHLGSKLDSQKSVLNLCSLVSQAGLNGVVCSSQEVKQIKQNFSDFICVTPGIRRESDTLNDQSRSMTPKQAIAEGSDYLVVGRPITQAKDPVKAFEEICSN